MTNLTISDYMKEQEKRHASFIQNWTWSEVVECWKNILVSFDTPLLPLFQKVPVFDPSAPFGKNIGGSSNKAFFDYWRPNKFRKKHLKIQNFYLENPGTYGPLNYFQLQSKGIYHTLELLYQNRNDTEGIAATMIAASLFERMGSSRSVYPKDNWPSHSQMEVLRYWASICMREKKSGRGWSSACTQVLPRSHHVRDISDYIFKINSMAGIINFLANEHAKILNQFRFVEIFFSQQFDESIMSHISEEKVKTANALASKRRIEIDQQNKKNAEAHAQWEKAQEKQRLERKKIDDQEREQREFRIVNDNPIACDWSFLTKKQLERLIWLKSTLELSKQLGVSDVAISKRCHREGIQKPPRGFWAKVKAGKIKHPRGRVAKSKSKNNQGLK